MNTEETMTYTSEEELNGMQSSIDKFITFLNKETKRKHSFNKRNLNILDDEGFIIYNCLFIGGGSIYFGCVYTLLKRRRWDYLYLAISYNDFPNIKYQSTQILPFLNENENLTGNHSPAVLKQLAVDLNNLIHTLENNYEFYLIGEQGKAYILLDTFSLKVRWSIREDGGWRFHFFTTRQDYYEEVEVSKEDFVLNFKNAVDNYINKMELIYSFKAESYTHSLKYPNLCSYLRRNFGLLDSEHEKFVAFIEKKTTLSPLELELEISNAKDVTLAPHSVWISRYAPKQNPDTYVVYDFMTKSGVQRRLYFGKYKDSIYQFVKKENKYKMMQGAAE
jgi:hypothetical protein